MPDKVTLCERCEQMKERQERSGFWIVAFCKPIKYKSNKYRIFYKQNK